jgi:hypothetical protein
MAKKPQKIETPEIDPEKWGEFESTLKRALDMPHKPHKPAESGPSKHKTKKSRAAR